MILPAMMLAALESAVNRCLRLDPATHRRVAQLSGKIIALELRGLNVTFYMLPHAGGIDLLGDYAGTPDTVISGAPFSLLRLGFGEDERRLLFEGAVEVRGDMELGQRFERILRGLDIDWEEQLSRILGDVAAHQLGVMWRGARGWGIQGSNNLRRDVRDYLQEETHYLPRPEEVDAFTAAVDVLRADADRLAARVRRVYGWQAQREES